MSRDEVPTLEDRIEQTREIDTIAARVAQAKVELAAADQWYREAQAVVTAKQAVLAQARADFAGALEQQYRDVGGETVTLRVKFDFAGPRQ